MTRLASEVGRLIYSTQRYSSGVCRSHSIKMSPGLPVRLVDSFTALKNIFQGFADLAEEENVDLFIFQKVQQCLQAASEVDRPSAKYYPI